MRRKISLPHAPALAGVLLGILNPALSEAQVAAACGQTEALTESLDLALSPGFEAVRRVVQLRRNEARYVEFTLDGTQGVTLRTEALGTDLAMALYDEAGQLLGWDDDSGGGLNPLVALELDAGRYCVQVRPIDAAPIDVAEFVLVFDSGVGLPPGQQPPCSDVEATRDLAFGLATPVDPVVVDDVTVPQIGWRDFRLSLAESLGLSIDLASGEFDTVLEVFDASGASIASNDDFSGTDSRIEQVFASGDYCVRARSFAGEGSAFTMAVSGADIAPPVLPCGDPARTAVLAAGFGRAATPVVLQGEVDPDLRQSWFSLNIAESIDLRLDSRSLVIDTMIELHDSSGALLEQNDDGPDGTDSRIETALEPGDYCVTVRGYGESAGPFDLSLVPAGMEPPPPQMERPDPATATSVENMGALGDAVRSYTIGGDATLWASFTLEASASVIVNGMSISSDFSVALFAEDGTPLGEAGSVPAMTPADLAVDLPAGAFLVALTNHGAFGTILRQITVTRN